MATCYTFKRRGGAEHMERTPRPVINAAALIRGRPPGLQLSLIEGCLPHARWNNQREIESRLKSSAARL